MDQATHACALCDEPFTIRPRGRHRVYCSRRCVERASRDRLSQRADGPPCKCGCGQPVNWNPGKQRWRAYLPSHYRKAAAYKDEAWLRAEYEQKRRTTHEIASIAGVNRTTISHWMDQFGIAYRDHSEARTGRHVGALNGQWRGGVAQWPYSPGWKALARRIRDRDQWTCQDCGEQRQRWGVYLHVHHIDGDKRNDDPGNLISLCAQCHRTRHLREP